MPSPVHPATIFLIKVGHRVSKADNPQGESEVNVVHRMATALRSLPLLSSFQTLDYPLPRTLLLPCPGRTLAVASRVPAGSPYGLSRSFSTVAVATEGAVETEDRRQKEDSVEERVFLPTNESSQRLLRIRHTVLPTFLIPLASFLFCLEEKSFF